MNFIDFLIIAVTIAVVDCNTQPPDGIYSEYLRKLSQAQNEPPKGSTRMPSQNELRPEPLGRTNYYSEAPLRSRDPFYGYHGYGRIPERIERRPTGGYTRPVNKHGDYHGKTSPISYDIPNSDSHTSPVFRSTPIPPALRPHDNGRLPYYSTRVPSMTPDGVHVHGPDGNIQTNDIPSDHPPTQEFSTPTSSPDLPTTSPPTVSPAFTNAPDSGHPLVERPVAPELPNIDMDHNSKKDHPDFRNDKQMNPDAPYPNQMKSPNPDMNPGQLNINEKNPENSASSQMNPENQNKNHEYFANQMDPRQPVMFPTNPRQPNMNGMVPRQGDFDPRNRGHYIQNQMNPEEQRGPPMDPEWQNSRGVNPDEVYSPFSTNYQPENGQDNDESHFPVRPLQSMDNLEYNDNAHEHSAPPDSKIGVVKTKIFITPTTPPTDPTPQTTPTTFMTPTEPHGLNDDDKSSNKSYEMFLTTTSAYTWSTKVIPTSVSLDVESISNEQKDDLEKDSNVPERSEMEAENFDYDSEAESTQENYSDFYDDVYPDAKTFHEEYPGNEGERESQGTDETYDESLNGTTADNEWPDYANGVLYMGGNPTNETDRVNSTNLAKDNGMTSSNSTVLATKDDEKHHIMILAVIIGVSVVLIVVITIAIVIVNHLRRKVEEPKLLNFMHNNYCNLAETSFTTGFTNRAYEELDDQSSIARSMENLAAKKLASDSRTKLVGKYPAQMYGNYQNGASLYDYTNGYSQNGFAHGYHSDLVTPVEIDDDPDLNLTLAAAPMARREEVRSVSSDSTDDLFVRNDFLDAMAHSVPDDNCNVRDDSKENECINPLYLSSHDLSGLDDQASDDTAQYARDNYRNKFLENGTILATSTPQGAPPSGLYRTSSCPDCHSALDNLSDDVFLGPTGESLKAANAQVPIHNVNAEDLRKAASETNIARHLSLCEGHNNQNSHLNQSLCSLGSKVVNDRWEMRTGF